MVQAQRVTTGYVGALLTLFLLAMGTAGYGAVTAFKLTLFLWLTGLWLAALLLCLVRYRVPLGRPDRWDLLILGYGGLTLLSGLVHRAPLLGLSRREGPLVIALYCLIALGCRRFFRPKAGMLHLLGAVMTVWSVIALVQFGGGNPFGFYPQGLTWQDAGVAYSGAYISTTGNTDLAGALLCLCIPALAGGLIRLPGKSRYWLALPLGLCTGVLALMEVRGAQLGLLVGGLFALPLLLPVSDNVRHRLWTLAAGLLVCSLILVWCVRLPGTLGEAHDLLHGNADQFTGAGRVYIWKHCLALIPEQPLLGTGPDLLYTAGLGFERYDPEQNVIFRSSIDTAHNELLNAAVQQGIPAALCFLGAILLSIFGKNKSTAARIARAGLLCWSVQACFGFSMVNTAPYFWLTLALCAPEGSV